MIASLSIDYLVRLKNASLAGSPSIVSPYSKFCLAIAQILKKNNFIADFRVIEGKSFKQLETILAYDQDQPKIRQVEIISKPSRHLYHKAASLPWGTNRDSLIIVSTSSGLMSQKEANNKKIGGEIIAQIS